MSAQKAPPPPEKKFLEIDPGPVVTAVVKICVSNGMLLRKISKLYAL